jgi:ribosome-associated translation inhibitor RaiA
MDIQIKATNFELNPGISAYLDERIQTIERHLGDDASRTRFEVELGRDAAHSQNGEHWFAEFQARVTGGNYARVVGKGESVNAAIDAAKDDMLRKLRTSKKERAGFLKKSGAALKNLLRMG